jgi:hypothetical protein
MLFNSFQYWIFLIVAVLFYGMPFRIETTAPVCKLRILYVVDPRFIVLILTSTVVDYFLGIWLR